MPEKMSVMKQKFITDFLETDEIGKQITKGQIDIAMGIEILHNMIKYVRFDIKTLDQDAYKKLENIITELGEINHSNKEKIIHGLKEPEDAIDERNQKRILLKEDLMKYKQELQAIQELAYNKGWFD